MKYIFLLLCSVSFTLSAQQGEISGVVRNQEGPVSYASVALKGTSFGTTTDDQGKYRLTNIPYGEYQLVIAAVGSFKEEQTIQVTEKPLQLKTKLRQADTELKEIVVTGTMKETFVDESPVKVEVITAKFLRTNPTNNVMQALQTVNGVQEQINCGVCATNDIHINGMEGPYTLVLIDGMPIMSALATVYGFNGVPTSLIERIEIIKGPSSTLYGTEAVGGVINIITKKHASLPLISLNSFYTTHQELNTDLAIAPSVGKKVNTVISANFYNNQYRMDYNGDDFTDIPLNNRYSLFNKWSWKDKQGRTSSIAGRYYEEDRFGGTMQWQEEHRGSDSVYGESIYTKRYEVIGTYHLPLKERVKIDYSYNHHDQDSYYGDTYYKADQSIYFANLIWNKVFGRHDLLTGATFRNQLYHDNSMANTDEQRFIPGLFVQDEISLKDKTTLLAGVRYDYHEKHGNIISPRINLKHKFGVYTTMRLNLGTGFRLVHLFTEDHAALTGSRTVQIKNDLQPEESYNASLNFNHIFAAKKGYGTFDMDVFYTYFTNKIVPDYETDQNLIIYDNLQGYGVTRGIAPSIHYAFEFPLRLRVGGTFQDVYQILADGTKEQQLFAPWFSGVYSAGYEFKKWGLSINYTGRVMGPQHLPTYEAPFNREEISPWFSLQNMQLTKKWKTFELYGGVKNILNYTQPTPLIDPGQPFGDNFDTAYAYGPLQQRRYYIGLRWKLDRKAE